MLAQGHAHARSYPLGYLATEATFARHRINDMVAQQVVALHAAMASVATKSGGSYFRRVMKGLARGD